MSKIQAIRGMNDILPQDSSAWQYVESVFRDLAASYGYQEIRFPVLEQTALFKRSIGEVTDIVEKEMYSFDDRNGDNLSLRPEGTAGCVRAADQHGLLYNQQQRLWYQGPMFRHERPQKGRYRQFHQFGLEAFGMAGPDIDAEIIQLSHQLWQALGIRDHVTLELNNIGHSADRRAFGSALTGFLSQHESQLDDDSRNRMHSNPLRVLDSKNPEIQALLQNAPLLQDFLNEDSKAHFEELKSYLDRLDIPYTLNGRLVRGLDYYNNCVFEWTTESLGAQGTVCGGGRYDGLVEQLGGRATHGAGFAIGVERLILMLTTLDKLPQEALGLLDVYIVVPPDITGATAQVLARDLRDRCPELTILSHCGSGKPSAQVKRAFARGARVALTLIAGEAGEPQSARLKFLQDERPDQQLAIEDLADVLGSLGAAG